MGENILSQTKLEIDRLRNVFKFLLGNLPQHIAVDDLLKNEELLPIDRYILHSLALHCKQVDEFYNQFLFNKVVQQTQLFVASTLSSFYFDLVKDRLYCDLSDSKKRKSVNTVMFQVLNNLQATISPILPVLCREVSLHSSIPHEKLDESTLLYQYSVDQKWLDYNLQTEIEFLIYVKEEIKMLVRNTLGVEEAIPTKELNKLDLLITPLCNSSRDILTKFGCDELREIFQVSTISIGSSESDFKKINQHYITEGSNIGDEKNLVNVKISNTKQKLCPRCRLYLTDSQNNNDTLCCRCENVLQYTS